MANDIEPEYKELLQNSSSQSQGSKVDPSLVVDPNLWDQDAMNRIKPPF
jgi:hypothetical protein